jgi:hypothetical protein
MAAALAAGSAAFLVATPARALQVAPQPPLTAEQAIARQQATLERTLGIGCAREQGEIVVCAPLGRGAVEFPDEEGARRRLVAGEPPGAAAALDAGRTGCPNVGASHNCRGGLDVFRAANVLYKLGRHLAGEDD